MQTKSAARFALLIVALVITACASRPPSRAPRAPAPQPTPAPSEGRTTSSKPNSSVQYDKFTGSCNGWDSYIAQTGVQDCRGQMHPGSIGHTNCSVAATGYSYTPKREKGILGRTCFSIDLPSNPNQFHLTSSCIRVVDWAPSNSITQSCADGRSDWLNRVLVHEQQHAYHCEMEVWKANRRWLKRNHHYSGCGFTESGALRELIGKIDALLKDEIERITEAIDRESDRFHASPQGQPITTNCNVCK